jgi:hypothetical protein
VPLRFPSPSPPASLDGFPLSLGALAGTTGLSVLVALAPLAGFDAPPWWAVVPPTALLGWVAAASVPDLLDGLVRRGGHLAFAAFGAVPVAALLLVRAVVAEPGDLEPYALPALATAAVGALVASLGGSRRAELAVERGGVHARAVLRQTAPGRLLRWVAVGPIAVVAVEFAATGSVGPFDVLTAAGVAVAGGLFEGSRSVELRVLDAGLVVGEAGSPGGSLVPWRRVRRVEADGSALRVDRGLPFPTRYRGELPDPEEARRVANEIGRRRR